MDVAHTLQCKLQVVYKSGARKHFLAEKWTDALHFEMQELLMPCRTQHDQEWMKDACCEVLNLPRNHFDKVHGCVHSDKAAWRMHGKNKKTAPMQIIEFPNFLQRTHKLYVDWDKKLSDVEKLGGNFLPHPTNSENYGVIQRRTNVERIRQLALETPCAIMRFLESMGCQLLLHPDGDMRKDTSVQVYVKEGTRPIAPQTEAAGGSQKSSAANELKDWKISFHFVFQIFVSSTQFRMIYHRMSELIRDSSNHKDLAIALNLRDPDAEDECDGEDSQKNAATLRAMQNSQDGCLAGMDMHPRQNVYQGQTFLSYFSLNKMHSTKCALL